MYNWNFGTTVGPSHMLPRPRTIGFAQCLLVGIAQCFLVLNFCSLADWKLALAFDGVSPHLALAPTPQMFLIKNFENQDKYLQATQHKVSNSGFWLSQQLHSFRDYQRYMQGRSEKCCKSTKGGGFPKSLQQLRLPPKLLLGL